MTGILDEIIANKQAEVAERKSRTPLAELIKRIETAAPCRDFEAALRRKQGERINLLAEIKGASPSTGVMMESFDPAEIARLYEDSGAAALSVLTDKKYFAGTDEHLRQARAATSLPTLRKDFTIDEYQLYESRALGADAVLLMAQVLSPMKFEKLYRKAYELGLHVLAEGHTSDQIEFIASIGAEIIGINNRDFTKMTIDLRTTLHLRHLIPRNRVVVSQSGVSTREQVIQLDEADIDAIQVGSSLMKSGDMKQLIGELMGRS